MTCFKIDMTRTYFFPPIRFFASRVCRRSPTFRVLAYSRGQLIGEEIRYFCKKENSALLEHTCLTKHAIGWDKSKIITTHQCYHQHLCLEAWHINSAHTPLSCDDGCLLPDAYLHLVRKKGSSLVSI